MSYRPRGYQGGGQGGGGGGNRGRVVAAAREQTLEQKVTSLLVRIGDKADTLEKNVFDLAHTLASDLHSLGGHIMATLMDWCVWSAVERRVGCLLRCVVLR